MSNMTQIWAGYHAPWTMWHWHSDDTPRATKATRRTYTTREQTPKRQARGGGGQVRALMRHLPMTMRTRWECWDMSRMLEKCQRSCRTHQNLSADAQSKEVKSTHLRQPGNPGDHADALGVSGHNEDPRDWQKKLPKTLKWVWRCLELRIEEHLPQGALNKLDDLGDEMNILGDVHSVKDCTEGVMNKLIAETNAQNRDIGLGDPESNQEAMGHVEHDWNSVNDVKGAGYDGRQCQMNGATSSACCKSKRLKTQLLAED